MNGIRYITKEKFVQNITLFFLFLGGVNVFNYNFYYMIIAGVFFLLMRRNYTLDANVLFLTVLSASWCVFSPDISNLSLTTFLKPWLYPMMYLVGKNFFKVSKSYVRGEYIETRIRYIIIVLACGPYIHYLLNFFINSGALSRNTTDIWTGTVMSATGQAAMGCMILGVAIVYFMLSDRRIYKVISIMVVVSILLYNMILSGRTLLIMSVILILLCVIYISKETTGDLKKFKIIFTIMLFFFTGYVLIMNNVFGIYRYVLDSNLFERMDYLSSNNIFRDTRIEKKIFFLKNFYVSIFGGSKIYNLGEGYAHDLFLDTYDEGGIFALIGILGYILNVIKCLLNCLKNKCLMLKTRTLLLSVYSSFLIIFMLEPILQGLPWMFILFCFIHGLIVKLDSINNDGSEHRLRI